MRFVVYGAGAVGGVIGGHLSLAGLPVSLVARGDHLAAIREGGLRLDTATGMHRILTPATDSAAEIDWTPDTAVVLAVKSHQAARRWPTCVGMRRNRRRSCARPTAWPPRSGRCGCSRTSTACA